MRTILFILQKEFLQIFRNKAILPILTIMPIVQLIVLSYAASHEVKNVKLAIQNQDHSVYAQTLISKLEASRQFIISAMPTNGEAAVSLLEDNRADLVLVIPPNFETDFLREKEGDLQLLVNAINGSKAAIATGYVQQIVQDFRMEILQEMAPQALGNLPFPQIEVTYSNWYNPDLEYTTFMVPGILG
ncbi:MAG: ABC transporter permease, partial [Phaeodactylibacter sp.]|nr:ABC transporter permease [Phaeodactylibacter sp.]